VQHKWIGIGFEFGDDERGPVLHQAADEMHVAGQTIELCDDNRAALVDPAGGPERERIIFSAGILVYCGPVLRHPAEFMLPAVDLGGRVWLGDEPCKGGPAAPAFGD
jgi:hypothetical protein